MKLSLVPAIKRINILERNFVNIKKKFNELREGINYFCKCIRKVDLKSRR